MRCKMCLTCRYHRISDPGHCGHSSLGADQWSEMTRAWSHPRSDSASRVCPHPASSVTSWPRPWGTLCSNCTSCPPLAPPSPGTWRTSTCGHTLDTGWPRNWAAPRPGLRTEAVSVSADLHHWPRGDISSCPSWGSHEAAAGAEHWSAGRHVSPPSHSAANWQLKPESESREEMILQSTARHGCILNTEYFISSGSNFLSWMPALLVQITMILHENSQNWVSVFEDRI